MFVMKVIDLVLLARMMERASWDPRGGRARPDVPRLFERSRTGRVATATRLTVSPPKWSMRFRAFRGAQVKCHVLNLLPGFWVVHLACNTLHINGNLWVETGTVGAESDGKKN